VLERHHTTVGETRSSKSRPLNDAEAAELLRQVDTVVIARGGSIRSQAASETALADLRGPTGGYRAPLLRRGATLLVGFHPETLAGLLGG
jgi:hypothetical protein